MSIVRFTFLWPKPGKPLLAGTCETFAQPLLALAPTIPTQISFCIIAELPKLKAIAHSSAIQWNYALLLFEIAKFPLLLEAEKFVDTGLDASVRGSGDIVVVLLRVNRARSTCPTRFHDRVTTTTVAIHKSNLARSIANSMSAAKRIERDTIRVIT